MSCIDKIRQRRDCDCDCHGDESDTVIHPFKQPSIHQLPEQLVLLLLLLQFVAQFDFDGLLCFISLLTDSIVSGFYVSLSMRTPTTHTHTHSRTTVCS